MAERKADAAPPVRIDDISSRLYAHLCVCGLMNAAGLLLAGIGPLAAALCLTAACLAAGVCLIMDIPLAVACVLVLRDERDLEEAKATCRHLLPLDAAVIGLLPAMLLLGDWRLNAAVAAAGLAAWLLARFLPVKLAGPK